MFETLILWVGGVLILLVVLSMAASTGRLHSMFRRGGGAVIGNALMRGLAEGLAAFQAIEEPQRQYVREEKKGGLSRPARWPVPRDPPRSPSIAAGEPGSP